MLNSSLDSLHIGKPVGRLLADHFFYHHTEHFGGAGALGGERVGGLVDMHVSQGDGVGGVEDSSAGQHFVEHGSQGVLIGAGLGEATKLLGGHVVGGPCGESASGGGHEIGAFDDSEVGQYGLAVPEEDVGRLDVSVN